MPEQVLNLSPVNDALRGAIDGRVTRRAGGAGAQRSGVAAVEVPQLRPLQRQRVARVQHQQFVPGAAGGVPAAFQHLLHGC